MISISSVVTYIGQIITQLEKGVLSWEIAGGIANILMTAATIAAVVVASLALRNSRDSRWREFANSYFKEYRKPEMGEAVERLYHLYEQKDIQQIVLSYIDDCKKDPQLNLATRRVVSAFYQEISVISMQSKAIRKIAYTFWTKEDLERIVLRILLPIEQIAMKFILSNKKFSKKDVLDYIKKTTKNGEIIFSEEWAPAHRAMYYFAKNAEAKHRFPQFE
jgi:hypothetical protein